MLIIKKRKKNLSSAVLVSHRVKMKESEKIDKYLNLANKLKKLWSMKLTVIPTVVGAILKGLEKVWGNYKSEKESRLFRTQHC